MDPDKKAWIKNVFSSYACSLYIWKNYFQDIFSLLWDINILRKNIVLKRHSIFFSSFYCTKGSLEKLPPKINCKNYYGFLRKFSQTNNMIEEN